MTQNYSDYLEQTQHPRTGYWGPWYRFDDELIRVQTCHSLSTSSAIAAATVARWPLIVDTTLNETWKFPELVHDKSKENQIQQSS